jgi:hypothetical protein
MIPYRALENFQYNVSVKFVSGFKRDGKSEYGRMENLRNSQE